ncbi:MAG TPA: hypothetical protein VFZ89_14795 [Solirubrobacteraceae bacterium]
MRRVLMVVLVVVLAVPAGAAGQEIELPAADLNPLLALTGVAVPANVPVQRNAEPPLRAAPRADCGPGSRPLEGVQGRVSLAATQSADAKRGWTCNLDVVGHNGGAGGFRVHRYVDESGRECAYYDTALLHPANFISVPGLPSTGVAVLDMSDPAHPVQTDLLDSLPMQMPHESLSVNQARGLIAAEMGNGLTAPALMSIYDASKDCRRPVLQATTQVARLGHEGNFAPDGKTFWIGGGQGIAAVDVSDPRFPRKVWEGAVWSHGLSTSSDGTRLYVAEPIDGNVTILDVSDVQARRPSPKVTQISRLTWRPVAIPQGTAPMTIEGKRYLLEFDEFAWRFNAVPQTLNDAGAARIIDISDERHPRVVSNLRLEINQRDMRMKYGGDPGALSLAQGYAAHYCAIPREDDPQIVACSFINSGLRVFDIRDPEHPREVAYFVSPPARGISNGGQASDFAMSQPAFVPERREVWYTDAISGFYALRLDERAWPSPRRAACLSRRSVVVHFPGRPALRSVTVTVAGKRVRARRIGRSGVRVSLAKRPRGTFTVVVRGVTRSGRSVKTTRRYRTCGSS